MTTITFSSFGRQVTLSPEFARYANGRLAIKMVDCSDGSPYGTLTVNLPDQPLAEDEVFIKDWSENEYLVEAVIDAGWIEVIGTAPVSQWAAAKIAHLAGPLLASKANSLV